MRLKEGSSKLRSATARPAAALAPMLACAAVLLLRISAVALLAAPFVLAVVLIWG
jgi:hypothetical protein